MEKPTNQDLFNEMKERGFYVSKVGQVENEIEYLVVSAEPTKIKEVIYSDPILKNWTGNYSNGKQTS